MDIGLYSLFPSNHVFDVDIIDFFVAMPMYRSEPGGGVIIKESLQALSTASRHFNRHVVVVQVHTKCKLM